MIEMEVESLTSILNQTEFQVLSPSDAITNDPLTSKIAKVFRLSLIPNCNKKFVLVDGAKDITVELKCLPAIEIFMIIPKGYPSNYGPVFLMNTPFYQTFKQHLYDQLI